MYDKKFIEDGDYVKKYLNERENKIEESFSTVDNRLDDLMAEVDNISDMIDYPIEQEFGDTQYTKWKSGRLTQVIRHREQVSAGNSSVFVPLPVSGVGPSNAVATLRSSSIAYNRVSVQRALSRTSDVNVGVNSEADTEVEIIVFYEGRWK